MCLVWFLCVLYIMHISLCKIIYQSKNMCIIQSQKWYIKQFQLKLVSGKGCAFQLSFSTNILKQPLPITFCAVMYTVIYNIVYRCNLSSWTYLRAHLLLALIGHSGNIKEKRFIMMQCYVYECVEF